ncbi:hypothetical protein LJK88_23055 [Paenibacillus sp. P26]|nr:hypothetical protein LJK88_23055 [Paenibacillus sp. P26]
MAPVRKSLNTSRQEWFRVELKERLSVLKRYETDCFGVCLYLLQSEAMACEAAKLTLLELMKDHAFFAADARTKSDMLRKEALRRSLQIRRMQGRRLADHA